jgi:hypothetical protein
MVNPGVLGAVNMFPLNDPPPNITDQLTPGPTS